MGDLPEVINAEEAAKLLRIHVKHLRELAANKKVPCRRLGKEYRFNRQAMLDWLAGAEVCETQSHRNKR